MPEGHRTADFAGPQAIGPGRRRGRVWDGAHCGDSTPAVLARHQCRESTEVGMVVADDHLRSLADQSVDPRGTVTGAECIPNGRTLAVLIPPPPDTASWSPLLPRRCSPRHATTASPRPCSGPTMQNTSSSSSPTASSRSPTHSSRNSIHWPLPVTSGAGPANRPAPARERANGPHNRKVWLPGGPHARSHHTVWLPADYVATSTRIGYWR